MGLHARPRPPPRFVPQASRSGPGAETTAAMHQMSAANDHAKAVHVLVDERAPFGPPGPDGGNAPATTVAGIGHLDDVHRGQNAYLGVMPGNPTVLPKDQKPTRHMRLPERSDTKHAKNEKPPGHTIDNVPGGMGSQAMVGPVDLRPCLFLLSAMGKCGRCTRKWVVTGVTTMVLTTAPV